KDLNGDPLYEEKPVLDMMRWTRTIEEIGQAHTQMSTSAANFNNASY
ncbi:MAG: hypothetical protein GWN18_13155, partial [Thermoplasmata archaeon]|nr:hypothetical protein [Thermoplasmata archaeon]NIT77029.1 hypothetical protein [Thermoplasmata archaeon]NIU49966.1 hypothetical protein [Thermoplasmata archaeon]NIV79662.1 hypothetical protein [Thermoplasmata archaeon]NIW83477.1 hypothetical protein [Thermoplasmata archaeon]